MKYFYKQLISFLVVSFASIFVVSLFYFTNTRNNVISNAEDQLIRFAETIVQSGMKAGDIEQGQKILGSREIVFAVYTANNYYVEAASGNLNETEFESGLGQASLDQLKAGQILNNPVETRDPHVIQIFYPIFTTASDYVGFIRLAQPISNLELEINSLTRGSTIAFFLSAALSIMVSLLITNYHIQKINRLRKATKEIAAGNYQLDWVDHTPIDEFEGDEIDELMVDFGKMAKSLEASNAEVKRQQAISQQMVLDVAHEMRTPLTTISGIIEGLEHDLIPEKRKQRSMELIGRETNRLIRMVNENLDYEKIRTNQITLKKMTFKGKELLQDIVEQLAPKALEKGTQLELICEDDFLIYADHDRFKQIIFNITNNAVQFTDNGQIKIRARNEKEMSMIQIEDSGIGMSAEEVAKIWDRFYKADISRKNNRFGESGIGLSIVKQLVEIHHGMIEVTSEKHVGTVFTIRMPLKENDN